MRIIGGFSLVVGGNKVSMTSGLLWLNKYEIKVSSLSVLYSIPNNKLILALKEGM